MEISHDEYIMLRAALLAYTKSKSVTVANFDTARILYGKVDTAWENREESKQ